MEIFKKFTSKIKLVLSDCSEVVFFGDTLLGAYELPYEDMLKAFTFQKMSKEQFLQSINELIPSDENDSSTNIVQDNLYELYISFINAIEEFSDNPLGFQIVIQSSEGINVSPDLAQLFESTGSEENLGLEHYFNISVMQFLSNLLASENSSIVINANPDTK